MTKKELNKIYESIIEDANIHEKAAQQYRYKNDEKNAQYESGVAYGLRTTAIKIGNRS
jgi:hypothetical protein